MDDYQFTNNAKSTLASGISDSDLSLTVQAGEGALFPNPTGNEYFLCTLVDTSGNREIVKVTARSTDTFTIVREQEGTNGRAFSADDKVELRVTAGFLQSVVDELIDKWNLEGSEFKLDADGDTSITADTDDQIDVKVGGEDQFSILDGLIAPNTNNDLDFGSDSKRVKTVKSVGIDVSDTAVLNQVQTDTIIEKTADAGVTIDSLNVKDSKLNTDDSVVTSNITDLNVTEAKINTGAVTEGKLGDSAVAQAKLKTASGSVSQSNGQGVKTLPGGEYGFYPQTRINVISTTQVSGHHLGYATYNSGWEGYSMSVGDTGYITAITLYTANQYVTAYAQQRYVTSSGEVHWVFILKNKATQEIISVWEAPDHPCFGNGGKPLLRPHPFLDYDPAKHEIVVINPNRKQITDILSSTIITDENQHNREKIDVILEDYVLEMSNPPWPNIPITVGLPPHWEDLNIGEPIQPIKKIISKPGFITTARLQLK